MAAQWTYDAYGSVLSADHLLAHPFLHFGHKGLFFDRLDVGVADAAVPGAAAQETPRLVPFVHAIYHDRNRAYNPQFGRFMQMDPNAAGQTLIGAAAYNGRGMAALAVAFDLNSRFGNGGNLYQYLGSNSWVRSDPAGLSWDPFDLVDDYLAEDAGSKAAFLDSIGQGAKSVAILTAQIATFLPFPAANIAGELALVALGQQTSEQAAVGIAIGLIPAGKLGAIAGKGLGKIGSFIGRIGGSAWNAAKHYASKGASALWRAGKGVVSRAAEWAASKIARKAQGILEWGGFRKYAETAYEHVTKHGANNLKRRFQSVLIDDPVIMTEAAWARAQMLGLTRTADRGYDVVVVPMGYVVGYQGGKLGSGGALTSIRIVLEKDSNAVISSYPF